MQMLPNRPQGQARNCVDHDLSVDDDLFEVLQAVMLERGPYGSIF